MVGRYSLDPAMPVLLRPDGTVQVGWDPRRAVTVRPPGGLTAGALAAVLRRMQATAGMEELAREAARHGEVGAEELTGLIGALVGAGVARLQQNSDAGRAPSIRVHGRGPLAATMLDGLQRSGARLKHTSHAHAAVHSETTDLVVLTDVLVADPRLLRDLHDARVPHLQVRVRDGKGLVGPLVLPGLTSCLDCADLHRCDRDAAWPAVAAQLRDTVGSADRATVLATAALALGQVNTVLGALRGVPGPQPPATLSTTLEFDTSTSTITARHWPRHPRCTC
ncbi:cyclodehydratase [Mycobacterium sp. MS1601]|uniref:cyclodehydratase n=1 Tax=Mycobacterium sp. MS1601 TaxID=1936029 RepID=UPI00097942F6|nr:cyclodehydratase [Mycobacterium sp. MS1601]AQA01381.1 cyclodehydratase [Mycobacterium sp. MS1601]